MNVAKSSRSVSETRRAVPWPKEWNTKHVSPVRITHPKAKLSGYRYQDLPPDVQGLHDCCAQKPASSRKQKPPSQKAPPALDAADALAEQIGGLALATPPGLAAPAGGIASQSMPAVRSVSWNLGCLALSFGKL